MNARRIILALVIVSFALLTPLMSQDPVNPEVSADTLKTAKSVSETETSFSIVKTTRTDDQIFGFSISPYEIIQGRLAGLSVSSIDGSPYSDYKVTNIRNLNFLSLSSPLILIDGMPVIGTPLEINPKDIETISFLKDGTHAGIYGGQAANGVLLINTKSGCEKLSAHYSAGISLSKVQNKYDVYSADEYRKVVTDLWGSKYDVSEWFGDAKTDWQDVIYQTGVGHDHYLSLSGPVLRMPFFLSVGKTIREGVVKTSKYDRTTATLSLRPKFFDDHLSFGVNVKGIFDVNDIANDYAVQLALVADPTEPVYDNNEIDGFNSLDGLNPLARLEQTYNTITTNQWIGNICADYKVHFLPGLKISVNYGFVVTDKKESLAYDSIASWVQPDGYVSNLDATTDSRLFEASLDYSGKIEALSSAFGIKAGLSNYNSEYKIASTSGDYVDPENDSYYHYTDEDIRKALYGSFFWTLSDRYTVNFVLRQDSFSMFSNENRKGQSPSMLITWDLKKESFLSSNEGFSALKIFSGYSITGNYQHIEKSSGRYCINNDLKQEQISSFNLGADFGAFNDRLYGTIEYYNKKGENILIILNLPRTTNYDYLLINYGTIKSSGIDLSLSASVLSKTNLQWTVGANFIYEKNKIQDTEYDLSDGKIFYSSGHSVGSFHYYKQAYNDYGTPIRNEYMDSNGDGRVNEKDKYFVGSYYPSIITGLNSDIQYKNWNFSFSGRLHIDNYLWNSENYSSYYYSLINYNCSRLLNESKLYTPSLQSDYYVENASFFRMDFVSLGYKFTNLISKKIVLNISAALQNAFLITKYRGQDPEATGSVTNFGFPRPRTASLRLSVDF